MHSLPGPVGQTGVGDVELAVLGGCQHPAAGRVSGHRDPVGARRGVAGFVVPLGGAATPGHEDRSIGRAQGLGHGDQAVVAGDQRGPVQVGLAAGVFHLPARGVGGQAHSAAALRIVGRLGDIDHPAALDLGRHGKHRVAVVGGQHDHRAIAGGFEPYVSSIDQAAELLRDVDQHLGRRAFGATGRTCVEEVVRDHGVVGHAQRDHAALGKTARQHHRIDLRRVAADGVGVDEAAIGRDLGQGQARPSCAVAVRELDHQLRAGAAGQHQRAGRIVQSLAQTACDVGQGLVALFGVVATSGRDVVGLDAVEHRRG